MQNQQDTSDFLKQNHSENALVVIQFPDNKDKLLKTLELIKQIGEQTLLSLYIEIQGGQQYTNYDYFFQIQLIITQMITELKVKTPFFDFNLNFKDVFQGKLSILEDQSPVYNQKPNFTFYRIIVDKQIDIQKTNLDKNKFELIDFLGTQNNFQISQYINNFSQYLDQRIQKLETLKINSQENISILSQNRVALGGTFDYIHNGHKLLLSAALLIGKNIVIGITGDSMLVNKKNKEIIQSNYKRQQAVQNFIEFYGLQSKFKVEIEIIQDPIGPAGIGHLDSLVLSQETLKGGDIVNKFREEKGLNKAQIVSIELISGSSQEMNQNSQKTSSSTIRDYLLQKFNGDFNYLKQCWDQYLGVEEISQMWFYDMILYYSESQRYYHTLKHIESMFRFFDQIKQQLKNEKVVAITIWFHDVIYSPRRNDNEERSAELFKKFCEQNKNELQDLDQNQQKLIYDYIIATKHHTKINSDDNDLNIFLDIDLSILGAGPEVYDQYSADILLEYQHFNKKILYSERAKILQTFVDQQTLFKTQYFKEKYQQIAKDNLLREIQQLQQLSQSLV